MGGEVVNRYTFDIPIGTGKNGKQRYLKLAVSANSEEDAINAVLREKIITRDKIKEARKSLGDQIGEM